MRPPPLCHLLGIGPRLEHECSRHVNNACEDDFIFCKVDLHFGSCGHWVCPFITFGHPYCMTSLVHAGHDPRPIEASVDRELRPSGSANVSATQVSGGWPEVHTKVRRLDWVAFLICNGIGEDDPLRLNGFAIDTFVPNVAVFGR